MLQKEKYLAGTCPPAMRWHVTLDQALLVPQREKGRQVVLAAEPGHFWVTRGAVLVPQAFCDPECRVSLSNIMDVGVGIGTIVAEDLTSAPGGEDDYFFHWEEVAQGGDPPSFSS